MDLLLNHTGVFVSISLISVLFICLSIYMFFKNIKSERQLLAANKRYLDLINNIQGGVITCVFDRKSGSAHAIYINEGWTELTGYTFDDLNNTMHGNPHALISPEDCETANSDYIEQTSSGNVYKLQYRVIRKNGTVVWVIDRGVVNVDDFGNPQNQSILTEVGDIKEKEEELLRLAQTDPLTGLYNKTATSVLITDRLEDRRSKLHALMVLDIDNFKGINDSLGHIFGDTVLIKVSSHLRHLMRSQDIIGRIGGDEFMILMTDISSREAAESKADAICTTFRNICADENGICKVSCSMGIAFSTDGNNLQDLFVNADSAMYRAKDMGKDQYLVYKNGDNDSRTSFSEPAFIDRDMPETGSTEKNP